jgi:hypothetical protein
MRSKKKVCQQVDDGKKCGKPVTALGCCATHYKRIARERAGRPYLGGATEEGIRPVRISTRISTEAGLELQRLRADLGIKSDYGTAGLVLEHFARLRRAGLVPDPERDPSLDAA